MPKIVELIKRQANQVKKIRDPENIKKAVIAWTKKAERERLR